MLFDGGVDPAVTVRFLQAVDDLRRLAPPSAGSPSRSTWRSMCRSTSRLEDLARDASSWAQPSPSADVPRQPPAIDLEIAVPVNL